MVLTVTPIRLTSLFFRYLPYLTVILISGAIAAAFGSRILIEMSGDSSPPNFTKTIHDDWKGAAFVALLIGATYLFLIITLSFENIVISMARNRLSVTAQIFPNQKVWIVDSAEVGKFTSRGSSLRLLGSTGRCLLKINMRDRTTARKIASLLGEFYDL